MRWFKNIFLRSSSKAFASNGSVASACDINGNININNGIIINEVGEGHLNDIKEIFSDTSNKISSIDDSIKNLTGISDKTLINDAIDSQLDARIDELGELIKQRKTQTALELFEKLLEKETSKASHRILFRIKANIGFCKLLLGNEIEGANLLLEAYNFAPQEPKAISNKMIGLLFLEKKEQAFEFGKKSLEQDQENEALAGYVIQASRFFDDITEPLSLISEKLHNTASVFTGYILFLRLRHNNHWWSIAAEALKAHPNDEQLKVYAAEAILDKITCSLDFERHWLSSGQKQKIQESAIFLQEHWNNALTGDNVLIPYDYSVCCNLLLAYRILNQHEEMLVICNQVVDKQIEELNLLERVMQISIDCNSLEISNKIISKLPDTAQSTLLRFQFYIAKDSWSEVANISEQQIQELPTSEKPMISATVKLAKCKLLGTTETNEINSIFEEIKEDASACIAVAKLTEELGCDDLANQAYNTALNLIDGNSDYSSRLMVSSYSFHKQKWQDVINLLYGYIDVNYDDYPLRNLAISFLNNQPIQEKAVKFFEEFPKTILEINPYIRICGIFYFWYGKLDVAERYLSKAFENNKNDLGIFLPLIEIYKKERADKVRQLVHDVDISSMTGYSLEKIYLAQILKEYGRTKESIKYIYQLQKDYPDNPEIALGYFIFIIHSDEKLIPTPQFVEIDCWVSLKNQYDEQASFIICEKSDSQDNCYDLSHFFSKNALGLKIGNSFIQKRPVEDKIWTVVEIKHKYLYMLHEIMKNFEHKFPDFHGLYRFNIVNNDISIFLEMIKNASERDKEIANLYLEKQIPLSIVASITNKNTINFSGYIHWLGEDIRTCIGTAEERLGAANLIFYKASDNVVLDTYAAFIVAELDIFDVLKSIFRRLLIPQSSINEIKIFELENYPNGKEKMSMSWNNNQFIRHELSLEDNERIAKKISQLREYIEQNCESLPIAVPDDIDNLGSLTELKHSLDSIFLAKKESCYLLSEDLYYRQFSLSLFNNHLSIWLQPLITYALEQGVIDKNRHAKIILQLAAYRHGYLSITVDTLLTVLANDKTEKLIEFSTVADFIGGKDADIVSHFTVVNEFLFILWNKSNYPVSFKTKKATGILLERFFRVNQWAEAFVFLVHRNRTSKELITYLDGWFKGHFLPPDKLEEAFLRLFPK